MLATGRTGYEKLLADELATEGFAAGEMGPGWILTGGAQPLGVRRPSPAGRTAGSALPDLAFPHLMIAEPVDLRAASVNAQAASIAEFFAESLRGEQLETAWPCVFLAAGGRSGLNRRAAAVRRAFQESLKKKLPRVARLALPGSPRAAGPARGLFVFFASFDRAFMARDAILGGQHRMADDPAAPSRSYLKIEEAYGVLGAAPRPGETVCDLGAAPGGWSYSAAKHGARVTAVDHGPLKAGAKHHPGITHCREDAFRFRPAAGGTYDWLFCDLVEEPHHVLRNLVTPWLARRWCRRFVINLKFGRADPTALLSGLRASSSPFVAHTASFRIRHLYHDREEFTVMGEV
ncbi:MAG: rRNA methyltransferase [Verrucomicrobia bacterium RIFCSPLOWO2_12_FULL_64_8]|nr:MAG: rRNA methyltransferase [Verrucomicrobia bacterium RIFCSPLOWO2_12_FULL_64_8]